MEISLHEYLMQNSADTDTIQQAARVYVNEQLDYISKEEMVAKLKSASNDYNTISDILNQLETDNKLLEEASLFILSRAWEDTNEVERVKELIDSAKSKMPVIETGLLALVAMFGVMYCAWLYETHGQSSNTTKEEKKADGSVKKIQEIKYFPSPLSVLTNVLDFSKLFPSKKLDANTDNEDDQ